MYRSLVPEFFGGQAEFIKYTENSKESTSNLNAHNKLHWKHSKNYTHSTNTVSAACWCEGLSSRKQEG